MNNTVFERKRFFSNAGSPIRPLYKLMVEDDGSRHLVENGSEDFSAMIESFAESTDIHVALKRFTLGDDSLINAKNGEFFDATEMPKTYAEVLQKVIDAENIFLSLPVETKQKFNNDYRQFLAQFGSDKFNEVFNIKNDDVQKNVPTKKAKKDSTIDISEANTMVNDKVGDELE